MKHDPIASGKRKAVNVSIDTGIVAAAREAGLNLSQVCEAALRTAAKAERDRRWAEENREWAEAHHRWVEENELPLEHLRLF
ncbi:type II toxin-antitoxin system CcdA family antitoxin [Sphingomonas sp. TDK1]|uniref:type II toxin-antitoxin system CcdA family antitoxin n=1 Tax=Sphingomonas sp. TDK1 TaxID=453247 RepID=UPI0007D9C8AC|nr:type II toxin-antitoxin system CcdA family antitoxin [Sphingomonas sp. TDK1]OAN66397.1 post-segregation antitoxin CcdA [Sphingomonas sp. TDK1]